MSSTEEALAAQPQPPTNMVIFLGGSSKKHTYLKKAVEKYSQTPTKCQNLYTSYCHKYGYEKYTEHFKTKNKKIVGICPLMDSLIPFTDNMNKLWGLPHNDTETSQMRRNKALMHDTISQKTNHNTRYGSFFLIKDYLTNEKEFELNMKKHNLTYPIIIKPPTSGGTDGVRLCHSFNAVQKCVKKFLHQENGEKNTNITMMAQEFLNGEEYVVNTVSFDGQHRFTDIWRAYKTFIVDRYSFEAKDSDQKDENDTYYPYSMLYDYQEFESEIMNDSKIKMVAEYVETILNILGVKYGCGHSEVMYLPKENRVCLIELNARMHGGLPRANSLVGYDQMTCLAMSICDSPRFVNEIPKYYQSKDDSKESESVTVRAVFLKSKVNGKMNMNKLIEMKKLKTFKTFARSLFDGVNYWAEYQLKIAFCRSKLDEIEKSKDGNIIVGNEEDIEEKKQEYTDLLNKSLNVIGRIEKVEKTIDLISSPGAVVLEGILSDIKEDYQSIRDLENDLETGLFIPTSD